MEAKETIPQPTSGATAAKKQRERKPDPFFDLKYDLNDEGEVEQPQLAVIYRPEIERRTGPLGLVCPKHDTRGAEEQAKLIGASLEFEQVWLIRGTQLVDPQLWQRLKNHPPTGKEMQRLERKGVILVITPDIGEGNFSTSTSADFDLGDAQEIIANSNDVEWLRLCIAKDNRAPVYKACTARIRELEEAMRQPQKSTPAYSM